MALSQTGANYRNQSDLQRRDRVLGEALDDIASQIQATRSQGNFGESGPPQAPHPITSLLVAASGGFATVTVTHNSPPAGAVYVIEYSTTPTFQQPIRLTTASSIDNGVTLSLQQYLKGQTLYFRAAPKFPTSPLAPWVYFGGETTPTPMTF